MTKIILLSKHAVLCGNIIETVLKSNFMPEIKESYIDEIKKVSMALASISEPSDEVNAESQDIYDYTLALKNDIDKRNENLKGVAS